MFAVGAVSADGIDVIGYALGQLMVTAAQVTAHYVNEYADVEADRLVRNRTFFSGGSGVLARGELGAVVALRAAWVGSGVTIAAAAALASESSAAAAIGVIALAIAWSYSLPPMRLVATGWGELVTSLLVAGAVPVVGLLSQGDTPSASLWWSIAVLVPIHFAMMLAFELPDIDTDSAAGKKVLAVRIGRVQAIRLELALLAGAMVAAVVAGVIGELPSSVAWWTGAAIVPTVAATKARGPNRHHLRTASAVATLVLAGIGLLIALNA